MKLDMYHVDEVTHLNLIQQVEKLKLAQDTFLRRIKIITRCTPYQRFYLAKKLRSLNKITCFSGNSVGDSFALQESNVGLTMKSTSTIFTQDHSDLMIDKEF